MREVFQRVRHYPGTNSNNIILFELFKQEAGSTVGAEADPEKPAGLNSFNANEMSLNIICDVHIDQF